MPEFTDSQTRLIFNAVRHYQMTRTNLHGSEYWLCDEILDVLFDSVYTQKQEVPT